MDPSRLHPQARAAMQVQQRVPLTRATLPAARLSMVRATPSEVGSGAAIRSVVTVDAGGVPARLYRDAAHDAMPVVLYAHGGGWVMGGVDTHDGLCRHLAAASGWAVLSVDYRLAPEHPYPAAVDDMARALTWLRGPDAARHGLDPGRTAVAGDSVGGHLAAVTARRARDAGIGLAGQLLICPVIDPAAEYPALDEYGLDREEMGFFWDAFAPPGVDRTQPDLDPLRADLTGLPPAVVITAELDLLSAEGERYAAGLLAAGVPVTATRYQGLIHNFPRKLALFDAAHLALAQLAAALRRW
ncbi:alpha/beta hydrolase [Micromonospora sp. WMMD812]|uniref:alpha/beta hydrolase n=1 Tax=Micromonospora sp. WMMD812 TaxID=3015152 RepID=UPI00248D1A59|nr:alpha/beta hydrolase [Micromonospora sp. WMMD812]WBB68371.1 alpha/beta hydrolase [Micromonospora sp. WMMD812]